MPIGFSHYARRYLAGPEVLRQSLSSPVLFWESPSPKPEEPWLGTASGPHLPRPRPGEPVVFELTKNANKPNPFAFGITLGRVETNDLCVEDASISRFHAWFQKEARSNEWVVVDAESKNGTWVGPLKVTANQRTRLADETRLRFGDVEMEFLSVEALIRKIRDGLQ